MSPKAPALLTDKRIDEILDKAHYDAFVGKVTNGGMVGHLWNHIAARAIEAEVRTLAAGEQQEPVAWAIFDSQGFYETRDTEDKAKAFCERYNSRRLDDPLRPYSFAPLYAAPLREQGEENDGSAHPVDAASTPLPKDSTGHSVGE